MLWGFFWEQAAGLQILILICCNMLQYAHICPFHRSESDSISGNWCSILHHEGSLLERVPSWYSSLGSFEVHPLSLEFRRIREEQAMLCLWGSTLLFVYRIYNIRNIMALLQPSWNKSAGWEWQFHRLTFWQPTETMNSLFHSSFIGQLSQHRSSKVLWEVRISLHLCKSLGGIWRRDGRFFTCLVSNPQQIEWCFQDTGEIYLTFLCVQCSIVFLGGCYTYAHMYTYVHICTLHCIALPFLAWPFHCSTYYICMMMMMIEARWWLRKQKSESGSFLASSLLIDGIWVCQKTGDTPTFGFPCWYRILQKLCFICLRVPVIEHARHAPRWIHNFKTLNEDKRSEWPSSP